MISFLLTIDPNVTESMVTHFKKVAGKNKAAALNLLAELISDLNLILNNPFDRPPYNGPYIPIGKYAYVLSNKSARYKIIYQVEKNNAEGAFRIYVDCILDTLYIK